MYSLGYHATSLHLVTQHPVMHLYEGFELKNMVTSVAFGVLPELQNKDGPDPQRILLGIVKRTSQLTLKAALQQALVSNLDADDRALFFTDVTQYALKRHQQGSSNFEIALDVAPTALYANLLGVVSWFVVNETFDLVQFARSTDMKRSELSRRTTNNLKLLAGGIVLVPIFWSIGTLIYPGTGSLIGGSLGEIVVGQL